MLDQLVQIVYADTVISGGHWFPSGVLEMRKSWLATQVNVLTVTSPQ